MKKNFLRILAVVFVLVCSSSVMAQPGALWEKYRHDFSAGYGINSLLFNIGENDNVGANILLQRSSLNMSYRFFFAKNFAARASFSQLYARKNDKTENRFNREHLRIDYETSMTEFALMGEFHLFDETGMSSRQGERRARGDLSKLLKVGVSVFGGVAVTYFRPYGEYLGQQVELRPLADNPGFETEVNTYNQTNLHFPVGANIRYVINKNFRLGLEFSYRLGLRPYINQGSGVYYPEETNAATIPVTEWPNNYYLGYVHFDELDTPASDASLQDPKVGFFHTMITLAYRMKTRN